MLAKERQNKIVSMVNEQGSVLVKELSRQFRVTEDSIGKDLTLLQKKGLLRKTYGGAVKIRINIHDHDVSQRIGKNSEEKKKIAQKALQLIEDQDVIFLDISTVNLELANLLIEEERPVTVVTNMIDIMLVFTGKTNKKFIFLGGTFSEGKDGFVGALTNHEIQKFRFDKAFLGVVGVDLEGNKVTTYMAEDATTKRAILRCSQKSYMMLESRKLLAEGNYVYACVDDFTGAVLEKEVEPQIHRQMKQYMIDWII